MITINNNIKLGDSYKIKLDNEDKIKKIKYTSSNSKIISVSKDGLIKANKEGSANIECLIVNKKGNVYRFKYKIKSSSKVKTVKRNNSDINIKSQFPIVTLDETLKVDNKYKIKINCSYDNIKFTSKNDSIAKVTKYGYIKGISKGKTDILIKVNKNNIIYYYRINVKVK